MIKEENFNSYVMGRAVFFLTNPKHFIADWWKGRNLGGYHIPS